jgi:ABC-type multidrug transport system fused ATPase/permease subunit
VLDKESEIENRGNHPKPSFRTADSLLTGLLTIATSFIAGLWVLGGSYTLGTYTLVVAYTFQLSRSFRDIAGLMRTSMEMDLRISQLKFFLSLKPRLIFSENLKKNIPNPQSVALINAHFAYAGYGSEEKAYLEMIMDRSKKF